MSPSRVSVVEQGDGSPGLSTARLTTFHEAVG